jgi:L-seryl-tRNA(Ser) seleniumtransferase
MSTKPTQECKNVDHWPRRRPRSTKPTLHRDTLPHQPPFAAPSAGSEQSLTPPRRSTPKRRVASPRCPVFGPSRAVGELAKELDAPHALAVAAARATIEERREELQAGAQDDPDLVSRARERLARTQQPSLRRVINATGVIVHTNLGRAPLAEAARDAVTRAAQGYSNLEWDAETGARGSRHAHVEHLLTELTGAEAALAVNNGAAAVLLAAAALAGPGKEIVVSRGQLVEIGGGFRIPDVVGQAGARLVEVGTTNRTRRADYADALGEHTGAILRAHPSNFRQLGFVQEVEIEELCELGVPVIDDVGSGNLAEDLHLLADEPPVRRSVRGRRGARVLLRGQAARRPAGRRDGRHARRGRRRQAAPARPRAAARQALARRARGHAPPLSRRPRGPRAPDADHRRRDPPSPGRAARRRHRRGRRGRRQGRRRRLPLLELPGPVVAVQGRAEDLAARLRAGDPPIVGRIQDGRLLLDPRTLADDEIDLVRKALG